MLLKDFENCVDSLIDVSISHMLVNILGGLLDMISFYKKHVDFSYLVYYTHSYVD